MTKILLRIEAAWWRFQAARSAWRIRRIVRKLNASGTMQLPTDAAELVDRATRR